MPMDFPDMKSLERHAEMTGFRKPQDGETEEQFRAKLADFIQPKDMVEAMEIRAKVGLDKFNQMQEIDLLLRAFSAKRR